jgi:hypothetical protein
MQTGIVEQTPLQQAFGSPFGSTELMPQSIPQPPQWSSSVSRSTQHPSQQVWPGAQSPASRHVSISHCRMQPSSLQDVPDPQQKVRPPAVQTSSEAQQTSTVQIEVSAQQNRPLQTSSLGQQPPSTQVSPAPQHSSSHALAQHAPSMQVEPAAQQEPSQMAEPSGQRSQR